MPRYVQDAVDTSQVEGLEFYCVYGVTMLFMSHGRIDNRADDAGIVNCSHCLQGSLGICPHSDCEV